MSRPLVLVSVLAVTALSTEAHALEIAVSGVSIPGSTLTYTMTDANPGETVHLVRATGSGSGPCPAALGGLCLDLDANRAVLLTQVVADSNGEAEYLLTLPASVPAGTDLLLQAVAVRGVGGVDSVKSGVATVTIASASDVDGDGYDAAVDCDDDNPAVYPGALEICDGVDTDCDPATDEDGLISASGVNYTSIDDASNFSPAGTVVSICPGTHLGTVTVERDLVFVGVGGADVTIVDGNGAGSPVFDILDGAGVVRIDGLTLTGGFGGIGLDDDVDLEVRHSVITGNSALMGGGIRDRASALTPSNLTLEDVEISYNTSTWEGGGIFHATGDLSAHDVRFIGNIGEGGGGGLYVGNVTTSTTISDSTFHSNESLVSGSCHDDGGGILVNETAPPMVITNTDFGVGPTENLPTDIWLCNWSLGAVGYTTLQDGETLTCDTAVPECL